MIQRFEINGKKWLSSKYEDWRVFQISKITNEEWDFIYPEKGIVLKTRLLKEKPKVNF